RGIARFRLPRGRRDRAGKLKISLVSGRSFSALLAFERRSLGVGPANRFGGVIDGEQAEDQGQRPCPFGDGVARHAASVRAAQRAAPARAALRLRPRPVRGLLGAFGREGDPELRHSGGRGERQGDHDAGGAAGVVGEGARHDRFEPGAASVAAGVDRRAGAPLRLLPERDDDPGRGPALDDEEPDRGPDPHRDERPSLPLRDLSADPDRDQAGGRGDGEGRQVMTGLLHEREFSRKSFVKGGGALVVGFSLLGAATGASTAKAAFNPPVNLVDSWLTVLPNNTVELKTSHIDPGNGAPTGFMAIVAEEMNISLDQINHSVWDTNLLVNSGSTGGSTAIQNTGPNVRSAAAHAYQALLSLASARLGVPVGQLSVDKGVVSGGGKTVTYGELVGGKLINATIPTAQLNPGQGIAKAVKDYKIVGTRFPRKTIPEKVSGAYTYVHNVRLPGMLHGRVVRPRGQAGYGTGAPIASVDERSIAHIPGAKVVRSGDFLGVVAPREYDAIQA